MSKKEICHSTQKLEELDFSTKEIIEMIAPDKSEKVVITIKQRCWFDETKKKIVKDQVAHRAKYRLGRKMKKKDSPNKEE